MLSPDDSWSPLAIISIIIFPLTSLAGLANLMKSGKPLEWRAVFSVALNSGLLGVCIATGMIHKFGTESLMMIICISVMSGLGGNAMIDFALETFKSVVRASLKTKSDSKGKEDDE